MELNDLLGTPNSELTTDELEEKLRRLKKLKISATPKKASGKPKASKSNKSKQLDDLISKLSPEALKALLGKLEK